LRNDETPETPQAPGDLEDAIWVLTTVESDVRLKKNITVS
jgi:hypothetical protein